MQLWELYCDIRDTYVKKNIQIYRAKTEEELVRKFERTFYATTMVVISYILLIVMAIMGIVGATLIEVVRAFVG